MTSASRFTMTQIRPSGEIIGRGLLYFPPAITFTMTAPSQPYEEITGGGREIGGKPRLRLNWKQPRIYSILISIRISIPMPGLIPVDDPDTGNGMFIEANSDKALRYMQNAYNCIYTDSQRQISSLNYTINISTDANKPDSAHPSPPSM